MNARRAIDHGTHSQRALAEMLGPDSYVPTLAELEQAAIRKAMKLSRGSISKAASMLGLGRATLYRKLARMETI